MINLLWIHPVKPLITTLMLPPRHQKSAKKALWYYWPRQVLSPRSLLAGLIGLCLLGLGISAVQPNGVAHIRQVFYDATSPFFNLVTPPLQKLTNGLAQNVGLSDLTAENRRLRTENATLKEWYNRALQLQAENQSLREFVQLAPLPKQKLVTARVIADTGTAFGDALIVDAGDTQGITDHFIAMSADGVVGRVVAVGHHTSQIVLLTDSASRVPVVIENSRHRGLLVGDNRPQPALDYLPDGVTAAQGDRLVTSGHGGLFAPGLPVGIVVTTGGSQSDGLRGARVQPFADLRRLDYVQLVDFGRSQLLQEPVTMGSTVLDPLSAAVAPTNGPNALPSAPPSRANTPAVPAPGAQQHGR